MTRLRAATEGSRQTVHTYSAWLASQEIAAMTNSYALRVVAMVAIPAWGQRGDQVLVVYEDEDE